VALELAPDGGSGRIASRVGGAATVLDVSRVSHFFAKDKLTFAVPPAAKHVVDFTMAELEVASRRTAVVRITRATIVKRRFRSRKSIGSRRAARPAEGRPQDRAGCRARRVRELKEKLGI